jgi:hypothetical protein
MGIKDLFFGKKQEVDPLVGPAREGQEMAMQSQRMGIKDLQEYKPEKIAELQTQGQVAGLQNNLADIRRKIQQNIAKRGLQNTSIGQAAMTGAERDIGRQINMLQAGQPLLAEQLRQERAQNLLRAGGSVLGSQNIPINFSNARSGGIASLLGGVAGAAIGGKFGGAEGAKVGYQAGTGVGSAVQGMY